MEARETQMANEHVMRMREMRRETKRELEQVKADALKSVVKAQLDDCSSVALRLEKMGVDLTPDRLALIT